MEQNMTHSIDKIVSCESGSSGWSTYEKCPECSSLVPKVSGIHPHPYIGGSSGCWAVYGEVLAREYSAPAYMDIHRLTVDAYSVQHPGNAERRSTQSVYGHLVSLYLVIEKGFDHASATAALRQFVHRKLNLAWLDPPKNRGSVTIVDVLAAKTPDEHKKVVVLWAQEAWEAWAMYHEKIQKMVEKCRGSANNCSSDPATSPRKTP